MRVVLAAAFSALMLSPSMAATENTPAQSENSLICRQPTAIKGSFRRPPVCHTATKWAQLDDQKRRWVAHSINTSSDTSGTQLP